MRESEAGRHKGRERKRKRESIKIRKRERDEYACICLFSETEGRREMASHKQTRDTDESVSNGISPLITLITILLPYFLFSLPYDLSFHVFFCPFSFYLTHLQGS